MNTYLMLGILLLPNSESLLPISPSIRIMIVIQLAFLASAQIGTTNFKYGHFLSNLTMRNKVALIVCAKVLLLIAFAAKYQLVLGKGETITLQTRRYDPVD